MSAVADRATGTPAHPTDAFHGTSRRHTSEPRWPLDRPPLDPAARMHLLVAGPSRAAAASAAAWAIEAGRAGAQVRLVGQGVPADALQAEVRAAASRAPASARLLCAGDEALLGRAVAGALAAGMRPQEITAQLTDPDGPRLVQCVHCRALTETTAPVDGVGGCSGCGAPLLVFPHFSRRIGAYLGFHAEAEEL